MSKIGNFFKRLVYALPFSMKSGEILVNNSSSNDGISIQQTINQSTLAQDLLKGEVTQEVEELRYQTYKVSEEAKNYKYVGEGVAVKVDTDKTTKRINFRQLNQFNVRGVLDELERVNTKSYGKETYTLSLIHEDMPRFKMEKYCTNFEFDGNFSEDDGKVNKFVLYFDTLANVTDVTSRSFNNELDSIVNGHRSELSSIKTVEFITFNVYGENDLMKYHLEDLQLIGVSKNTNEYSLTYQIGKMDRENLIAKFYSKSMDEKYQNKAIKTATFNGMEIQEKRFCSECGREINRYDYAITTETVGKALCQNCLNKHLQDKDNTLVFK